MLCCDMLCKKPINTHHFIFGHSCCRLSVLVSLIRSLSKQLLWARDQTNNWKLSLNQNGCNCILDRAVKVTFVMIEDRWIELWYQDKKTHQTNPSSFRCILTLSALHYLIDLVICQFRSSSMIEYIEKCIYTFICTQAQATTEVPAHLPLPQQRNISH
jgi:hypothetical protein